MPDPVTIPNPDVPFGQCPHCGKEVKISPTWFQQLLKLVKQLNQNTTDLNP